MKKLIVLILSSALLLLGQTNILFANTKNTSGNNTNSSTVSDEELTNQDILDMLKNGLSDEVILSKIKTSRGAFDTSAKALQELKTAGASDSIIVAMVEAASSKPTRKTVIVKIPADTAISVESAFFVTSSTVNKGNIITFNVVQPIVIDGVTVIERGALVNGKIVKARKAGRWGREGYFTWTFEEVFTTSGKAIPLKADGSIKGESNKGEVAIKATAVGAILAPTIILAPLALMYGFKRGENALLPAGSRFMVYVKNDTEVSVTVN